MALSPYDQQVYDAGFEFIPQTRFLQNPFQLPESNIETDPNTGAGIATLPRGGRDITPFTGGISDLTSAFQTAADDRQARLTELNRPLTTFPSFKGTGIGFAQEAYNQATDALNRGVDPNLQGFGSFTGGTLTGLRDIAADQIEDFREKYRTGEFGPSVVREKPTFNRRIQDAIYSLPFINKPQSAEQIMQEGYTPSMKFGILSNILPDRFGSIARPDQAFIQSNMGYTGPTVFGENTTGGTKDPFGLNVRSGLGNYAERVGVEAEKLGDSLSGRLAEKYGVEFDPVTGTFVGKNAAKANQMTKMMRAKYNYYTQKTKERDELRAQDEARRMRESAANRKEARDITSRLDQEFKDASGGGFDVSGPDTSANPTGASNRASQERGFALHGADGGRVAYMMGGLADLVDIYD